MMMELTKIDGLRVLVTITQDILVMECKTHRTIAYLSLDRYWEVSESFDDIVKMISSDVEVCRLEKRREP